MRGTSVGIALKVANTLAFSLMYAVIKLAGPMPVGEVIFFRSAFALLPVLAFSALSAGLGQSISTTRPLFHILRSLAGLCGMFLNFAALARLPLADITGFSFVAPIFAVILATFMLNERASLYRWIALGAGFAGVLLMLQPHGGVLHLVRAGFSSGAGLALMGALLSAFVVVFIRQMSATEQSEAIVFYFMLTCAGVSGITCFWHWTTPNLAGAAWLMLAGVLGGIGQLCMTFSYRYAAPSLLAPFDYVAMVWAVALGFFILGEVPERMVMLGAAVVVGAGLFIIWRERRQHLASADAAEMAIQLSE
ncbi:MAG: DMT family transporter [Alphaproteobacteria bacterium]|nr:DMT family transporter [Alphaproteobacteria bacterium]MBV9062089.1 DMT family transporter [Alphaproteobacteria bacterium]